MSQGTQGTPDDPNQPPPPPLPEVEPPSAGFVVQLFILPFVVVSVVVLVWLLFGRLAGGERDASSYVETIRSSNETRRWRAAFELASLIQNDATLALDDELLATLSAELDRALEDPDADPRLRQYLARTLGAFRVREGTTRTGDSVDALSVLARALDGDQPAPVRLAAAESLARLAATESDPIERPEVVAALAATRDDVNARSELPELGELAVFAVGFFDGDSATGALREAVGPGEPSRFVRYNAAAALARRGDPAGMTTLREMLSTGDLERVIELESAEATRRKIEAIQLAALRALSDGRAEGSAAMVEELSPLIEDLADSDLASVRTEAARLLQN